MFKHLRPPVDNSEVVFVIYVIAQSNQCRLGVRRVTVLRVMVVSLVTEP